MLALPLTVWIACDPDVCPEGQVREEGTCVDYRADEPVGAAGVWTPAPGTSWQWQLTGVVDTSLNVAMYDVDLFDPSDEVFQALRDGGKALICYFSAGSYEPWRPDAGDFPEAAIGEVLEGWEDERWLDITDPGVRSIMAARLDYALARGCDGVEPDNVMAWQERTGFGINATEQLDYNRFLADEAHARGLSVGLKNDMAQGRELLDWFDWTLNESCLRYEECDTLDPFVDAGKAVFHVEYVEDWAEAPALADATCGVPGFSSIVKTWELGAELLTCP